MCSWAQGLPAGPHCRRVMGRMTGWSMKMPKPSWPWRPLPHDHRLPRSQMASVWLVPALTDTTRVRKATICAAPCLNQADLTEVLLQLSDPSECQTLQMLLQNPLGSGRAP